MKITCLSVLAVLLAAVSGHAAVMTGYIDWTGDAGYTAEIEFHFDDSIPIVSALTNYNNPTRLDEVGLIELWTTIRDPQGNLVKDSQGTTIPRTQMVQNGYLLDYYNYFEFYFDTQTLSIPSGKSIDVGPRSQYWIWGNSTEFGIQSDPGNIIVDSGSNFRITVVPEPRGLVLSMLAGGVMLIRRQRSV